MITDLNITIDYKHYTVIKLKKRKKIVQVHNTQYTRFTIFCKEYFREILAQTLYYRIVLITLGL